MAALGRYQVADKDTLGEKFKCLQYLTGWTCKRKGKPGRVTRRLKQFHVVSCLRRNNKGTESVLRIRTETFNRK